MTIEIIYKDKTAKRIQNLADLPLLSDDVVNIQFLNAKKEEIALIETRFAIDTSILNGGNDIEISSHYLENEQQIGINFSVPYFTSESKIVEENLCMIFKDNTIYTFTSVDFDEFVTGRQQYSHFDKSGHFKAGSFVSTDSYFLMIIGFVSDYFADLTEIVSKKIKTHFYEILTQNKFSELELDKITTLSFNNLIIEEAVSEYRHILRFFRKSDKISSEVKDRLFAELNDLTVVTEYIQNNFERLDDLKENISGKIDLEQNRIFKTLTIVTMCISLPTLIAGIYGMNFKIMPELEWDYGYVYGLALLALSFLLPLLWFKKKKWL